MASNKRGRTIAEGPMRISAGATGGEIWTEFKLGVQIDDEKHDDGRHIFYDAAIGRAEAARLASYLIERLMDKSENMPGPLGSQSAQSITLTVGKKTFALDQLGKYIDEPR